MKECLRLDFIIFLLEYNSDVLWDFFFSELILLGFFIWLGKEFYCLVIENEYGVVV